MITVSMYGAMLKNKGATLYKARRNHADMIMNATFAGDIGYKKVYILDKENGWHYEEAKYSKHATPSILKDAVDNYLQFRPKVHYPVGTYVFIPDDTSFDIGFEEEEPINPFKDSNFDINKLWLIVGRDDANDFVRYNILKCNWDFKWVARINGENKIMNVIGCVRNANSYTSGVWTADYSVSLDNITNAWVPDTYLIYNDKLSEFELCDTRYLRHEQRFMLTHNRLDPKVYAVTKVQDLVPQGIIKLTLKQDELNDVRDNLDLMICDYYSDSGEILPRRENELDKPIITLLWGAIISEDGILMKNRQPENILHIAQTTCYNVEFLSNGQPLEMDSEWRIKYIGTSDLTDVEKEQLCNMLIMRQIDNDAISIRPSKANRLIGERFELTVQDLSGDYTLSYNLEVQQ